MLNHCAQSTLFSGQGVACPLCGGMDSLLNPSAYVEAQGDRAERSDKNKRRDGLLRGIVRMLVAQHEPQSRPNVARCCRGLCYFGWCCFFFFYFSPKINWGGQKKRKKKNNRKRTRLNSSHMS